MRKITCLLLCFWSVAWAGPQGKVIRHYFEGYLKADTTLIKEAFHEQTRLLTTENGKLDTTSMKDWLISLDARRSNGDIRKGSLEILSLDVTGTAAQAKIRITFPKIVFTDYLSLLKIDGKWKIIGKIYSFKER